MNRRHLWQKQIVPMLNTIAFRCGPLLNLPVPWDNEAHALPVPFDDLTNYSDGLDFRTDAQGSARGILYRERERIQSEFGLYFDDFPGGIRWTMLPKLGMLWRYDEEQKRTESALKKTQEMTQQAIHASGGAVVERALFTAVDQQYQLVVKGAGKLRQITQALFGRQAALPAPATPERRRRPRR